MFVGVVVIAILAMWLFVLAVIWFLVKEATGIEDVEELKDIFRKKQ